MIRCSASGVAGGMVRMIRRRRRGTSAWRRWLRVSGELIISCACWMISLSMKVNRDDRENLARTAEAPGRRMPRMTSPSSVTKAMIVPVTGGSVVTPSWPTPLNRQGWLSARLSQR